MKLKKILASLTAAAMAVTTMAYAPVSVSAADDVDLGGKGTYNSAWTNVLVLGNGSAEMDYLLDYETLKIDFRLTQAGIDSVAADELWKYGEAFKVYGQDKVNWGNSEGNLIGYNNPYDGTSFNTTDSYVASIETRTILDDLLTITNAASDEEAVDMGQVLIQTGQIPGVIVDKIYLTGSRSYSVCVQNLFARS